MSNTTNILSGDAKTEREYTLADALNDLSPNDRLSDACESWHPWALEEALRESEQLDGIDQLGRQAQFRDDDTLCVWSEEDEEWLSYRFIRAETELIAS